MNTSFTIEIADEQNRTFDSSRLVKAVESILDDHGVRTAEISIAVVDDPTIRENNVRYLQHDYETDVISFVLDICEASKSLTGQLIVSSDTAFRVASETNSNWEDELLLYVIHGTLHLVGLDDKSPQLALEMRSAEQHYLGQMGITGITIADRDVDSSPDNTREADQT